MYDPEFKKFLSGSDIFFIQETWTQESAPPIVEGYRVYSIPAIKTHGKGRGSGGIATGIRVDMLVETEWVSHDCSDYVLVLLLKSKLLGTLLCINIYIPPKFSQACDKGQFWDKLFTLLEALIVQFPKAKFILGGDFNARIGSGQEAQSIGLNDLIVEQTLVKRISNDRCINKPGLKLLELLSSFDLCVLHGSRYDASGGAFTYISAQRASTIDYIAISADLFSRVLLFDILETSLSDHNPLWLSISCHKDLFLPPNLNANDTTGHRKPKWSDHLQRLVEQTLKSEEGLSFAKAILNPGCDLIGLYENLAKSLRSLFMHKKPSKPTSPMEHAWFDRECKTCKKKLLKCIRTARKFKDEASLTQLRRVKTQYKELLKLKKLEYSNRYWNKLQETVIRKNDTLFWDLISLGTKNPSLCTGTSISAGAWYDYYTKIFGNSRSNGTT